MHQTVRSVPDLSITQLRNFLLVADLRSFKAAAEQANRSQPALSLSIREMEERLGQPLFDRSMRGMPTAFGRQCLPLARQLVEQYDRFSVEIGRLANNQVGSLRIASVVTASTQWLCRVMPAYLQALPGVRVRPADPAGGASGTRDPQAEGTNAGAAGGGDAADAGGGCRKVKPRKNEPGLAARHRKVSGASVAGDYAAIVGNASSVRLEHFRPSHLGLRLRLL